MGKMMDKAAAMERADKITKYLAGKPGEYVPVGDIVRYGIGQPDMKPDTLRMWMRTHKALFPDVDSMRGRGYIYSPKKAVKPVVPPVLASTAVTAAAIATSHTATPSMKAAVTAAAETLKKNHEGYSDPTASKALRSLDNEEIVHFGEVWRATTRVGEEEKLLVLGSSKCVITCLKLIPKKLEKWDRPIRVMYQDTVYWADISEVTWRYIAAINKYGKPLMKLGDEEREFLRRKLGEYLHTAIVEERVVEKPVDKIRMIEKPVEKRVEVKVQDPLLKKRTEELEDLVATLKERLLHTESECATLRDRNAGLQALLDAKPETADATEVAILKAKLSVYESIIGKMFPERKETV